MNDYDIVIKLDPGQPVQGAKQITAAVAGVEAQSKKTQDAISNIGDGLKKQVTDVGELSKKWSELSKAMLGQALNDSFRKITDAAKEATGGVLDLNMAFAGYQVAGPWGAAIGALAGPLTKSANLMDAMGVSIDELEKKAQKQAKESMPAWTREIYAQVEAVQKQNAAWMELPRTMATVFESFTQVRNVLKDVDKDIKAYDESLRKTGLLMLVKANDQAGKGARKPEPAPPPLDYSKAYGNAYSEADVDAISGGRMQNGVFPNGFGLSGAGNYGVTLADAERGIQAQLDAYEQLQTNTKAWFSELEEVHRLNDLVADQFKTIGTTISSSIVDALNGADVSAAALGKSLVVGFEKAIAQALILKAITGSVSGAPGIGGGYGGLLGAIFGGSHADGGSYTAPATGGGPDSIPVMFRMSPRETATFTPHGQAFGGGTAPTAPINLNFSPQVYDERAILPLLEGANGQRVIYRMVQRAMGAIRPLGG